MHNQSPNEKIGFFEDPSKHQHKDLVAEIFAWANKVEQHLKNMNAVDKETALEEGYTSWNEAQETHDALISDLNKFMEVNAEQLASYGKAFRSEPSSGILGSLSETITKAKGDSSEANIGRLLQTVKFDLGVYMTNRHDGHDEAAESSDEDSYNSDDYKDPSYFPGLKYRGY